MSDRGTKFLDTWIAENIDSNSYPDENESKLSALTVKCVADAQSAGIAIDEIEEDAGPIDDCILEAMEEATDLAPSHVEGGRLG
jgi:hypothetical protein